MPEGKKGLKGAFHDEEGDIHTHLVVSGGSNTVFSGSGFIIVDEVKLFKDLFQLSSVESPIVIILVD